MHKLRLPKFGSKLEITQQHLVFAVITGLALVNAAVYAYSTIFSKFAFYDDQGFMMISLKGYLEGHPLYDQVFSTYGPFYFFWERAIHAITALPVTHDFTGILCLCHWLVASALIGFAAWGVTRSKIVGLFAGMQGVLHLRSLSNEPGHPQEQIAILLGLAVLIASGVFGEGCVMFILGVICALAVLTKINVGIFFCASFLLTLMTHAKPFWSRRFILWTVLWLLASFPFILVHSHLHEAWAFSFGLIAALTILASGAVMITFAREPCKGYKPCAEGFLGFCAAFILVTGGLLLGGSSGTATIDCLLRSSASLAASFSTPMSLRNSDWSAIASVIIAFGLVVWRNQNNAFRALVCIAKTCYGILGVAVLVRNPEGQFTYLLPWSWLILIPTRSEIPDSWFFARAFFCQTAAWQALQIYPVAGTQLAIGTFVCVLIYNICLFDGVTELKTYFRAQWELNMPRVRLVRASAIVGLLFLFTWTWCPGYRCWTYYESLTPINLPGTHRLRLAEWRVNTYRELTDYLKLNCDTFFTAPGFNSLFFWTGKEPPTYFNIAELSLLNRQQQSAVIQALQRSKKPLLAINERRAGDLSVAAVTGTGPLGIYLQSHFLERTNIHGCRIESANIMNASR